MRKDRLGVIQENTVGSETHEQNSIPARRRVDRHTGPAESDNPEVQGLHSEATTVQSSKSNSSRLLA